MGACAGADDGGGSGDAAADSGGSDTSGSSNSGEAVIPNGAPPLRRLVEVATVCGADGTIGLRATQVACVKLPPAPCTLPSPPRVFEGPTIACPSDTESELLVETSLRAAIPWSWRTAAANVTCFSNTAESEVVVDDDAVVCKPTVALSMAVGC
ncbi:MAG: hypothetical protein JKY37_10460 [Nannocystaceae bacterium]|nr:hypothetical protein [Nannocystaceae bacterium]